MSTVRTQGVTAIYTGLSALVIGTAAKAGVRFFAFDQFRDLLKDSEGKTTGVRSVLGKRKIDQGVNVFSSQVSANPTLTYSNVISMNASLQRDWEQE